MWFKTNKELNKTIDNLNSVIKELREQNDNLIKHLWEAREHNKELDKLLHMWVNREK